MHAGNIFSALIAWLTAKTQGGDMVLRIEDLDRARSKSLYVDDVQRDFEMLGLTWDRGPLHQSERGEAYAEALERLDDQGLLYPCYCSRADLHASSAPHRGDTFIYAGTCRNLTEEQRAEKERAGRHGALRVAVPHERIEIEDLFQGRYSELLSEDCGDFIVRRSDGEYAYQLAVVVDDAEQGVTSVVRGVDLLDSSPRQRFLQRRLGLYEVEYGHVPLIVAADGRRLSKRDKDASLDGLLETYRSPEAINAHLMELAGFETDGVGAPEELARYLTIDDIRTTLQGKDSLTWE